FRDARVTARWEPVPSPKKIRQGVTKATRRLFYERLEGAEFNEAELTYAQNLLEKHPPAHVVSLLLRMSEPALPREPIEIAPAEPRAWDASATPQRARPSSAPEPRPRANGTGFTRFSISWGAKTGATAARCMSHVCRRGGITRHLIGAIQVDADSTSIEVSNEVAAEFERRCRTPDTRDRNVHITRDGAPPPAPGRMAPIESAGRGFEPHRPEFTTRPPGSRVKRAARRQRSVARVSEA
ncbi:MAG TPA: DbpA RNA binding domain-containing protein, partial [Polyangiaceae bacterium]|nr:DbpA RNA binding domain-containing protein [Polyangiaceae bacterium]